MDMVCGKPLLICFSHLRWNFVFQRPQHLLTRFAKIFDVLYVEEPWFEDIATPRLDVTEDPTGITAAVPVFRWDSDLARRDATQRALLDDLLEQHRNRRLILWYYTPLALGFSDHLHGAVTVYDCMDELSAFKFAPAELREREAELLARADLVFTGGQSLYEAKRKQRSAVYAFPSSVDVEHFAQAREPRAEAADQVVIPHPRLGFFGVLDERIDFHLLREVAGRRPDWHIVMVGPTAKIDEEDLPRSTNIHYLGPKSYAELPDYIAGWDVALLPFALNESTRFISPTKTPEYLAAGKPVVSTPITDVVRPYGVNGFVAIADGTDGFIAAAERCLVQQDRAAWLAKVDAFLAQQSWDKTWAGMRDLVLQHLAVDEKTPEMQRREPALAI